MSARLNVVGREVGRNYTFLSVTVAQDSLDLQEFSGIHILTFALWKLRGCCWPVASRTGRQDTHLLYIASYKNAMRLEITHHMYILIVIKC